MSVVRHDESGRAVVANHVVDEAVQEVGTVRVQVEPSQSPVQWPAVGKSDTVARMSTAAQGAALETDAAPLIDGAIFKNQGSLESRVGVYGTGGEKAVVLRVHPELIPVIFAVRERTVTVDAPASLGGTRIVRVQEEWVGALRVVEWVASGSVPLIRRDDFVDHSHALGLSRHLRLKKAALVGPRHGDGGEGFDH